MIRAVMIVMIGLLSSSVVSAGQVKFIKPSEHDRCPVCGMFVAKYPDFLAEIIFKDGSYAVFDGAKDLFQYYLDPAKFDPSKKTDDVDLLIVKDYYSLEPIDGFKAYYVVGSNVYGPMGHELIPFENEDAAREFMVDHAGKALLPFDAVDARVLKSLE